MYSRAQRPNIVLIMMDATRADRLSSYGYERSTTPTLDRIASGGVLYERAIAPDVWTLPVVSSIFTGLLPHEHGVDFGNAQLPKGVVTLAKRMSQLGYDTWGISPGVWVGPSTSLDRGFEQFVEPYRLLKTRRLAPISDKLNRFYAKYIFQRRDKGAGQINDLALSWLRRRSKTKPFFMFIHYMEPHYPYRPPAAYARQFLPDPEQYRRALQIEHNPLDFFAGRIEIDQEEFTLLNLLYDAELAYLDARIAELEEALTQMGLSDETVLFLFSDHGENIGDHGLLDHHFALYDTLIHVPLILRGPGLPVGMRVPEPVETRHLFHLVLELAEGNNQVGSTTLSTAAFGPDWTPRGYAVSETTGQFVDSIDTGNMSRMRALYKHNLYAVRTSQHKYIERSDGVAEFYRLTDDPDEQVNRIDSLAGEPELLRLQAIVKEEFLLEKNNSKLEKKPEPFGEDPVVTDRLRSLGYLE